MRRNVAGQYVGAQMITAADGTAFTGAVTVYVTGDAGTQAAGSVGSGACTHEGNGFHTYAPAQAETNYTHVAFTFIGTGAIPATVQIYPIAYDANGRADVGLIEGSDATDQIRDAVVDDATRIDASALNTLSGHDPGGQIAAQSDITGLNDPTAAAIRAEMDANSTQLAAIVADTNELQTDDIPGLIAGLNNLSSAEAQAAADAALVANNLDHLMKTEVSDTSQLGSGGGNEVVDGTVLGAILSASGDPDAFNLATDSLQAIRDQGDAAWITATGFSTHSAADVRTEMDANSTQLAAIVADTNELQTDDVPGLIDGLNDPTAAAVADAVWEEAIADHSGTGGSTAEALAGAIAPSAADLADAVWDEAIGDHLDAGSTGAKLNSAASAGDPWTTELPGAYGAGTAGYIIGNSATLGAGSIAWTVTVNDDGDNPLDGVDVWVSTDEAGTNIIARGTTDDSGQVTFMLDAGTYYFWKQLAGYSFTNPESDTVS